MSKIVQDAYIVAAMRTPVARRKGAFANVRPDDMLAHALKQAVVAVPGFDPREIGDIVVGCAMPEAEQGMNVARIGALLAGLPDSVPAITVNRFCASGLNAVAMAADRIRLGECEVAIGAGTESMTVMAQMVGNKVAANPAFFNDANRAIAFGMGITAENVAARWQVTREQQDAFAAESHRRALAAIAGGQFKAEISPYEVREHLPDLASGAVKIRQRMFENDEGPRPGTTVASLAKLKPVFAARGSVTAGNASQMSDGAAAVLLMSEAAVKRYNVTPLARFVSYAVVGVPPNVNAQEFLAQLQRNFARYVWQVSLVGAPATDASDVSVDITRVHFTNMGTGALLDSEGGHPTQGGVSANTGIAPLGQVPNSTQEWSFEQRSGSTGSDRPLASGDVVAIRRAYAGVAGQPNDPRGLLCTRTTANLAFSNGETYGTGPVASGMAFMVVKVTDAWNSSAAAATPATREMAALAH